MRVTAYDFLGIMALCVGGLMSLATYNAWSDLNAYGQKVGILAAVACFGACIGLITINRSVRLQRIGYHLFLVTLAAFLIFVYTQFLIPDILQRFRM